MDATDGLSVSLGLEDNEDLEVALSVAAHMRHAERQRRRRRRTARGKSLRGSVPGRAPNRPRDFAAGLHNILRDYWGVDGEPPVYQEVDFERRFRVPRAVFMKVYNAVKEEPFFKQRINATGRPQAHPLQKVVAAFRVIAYGESYDRADEYVRLSRSTVQVATKKLMAFIVERYSSVYLRDPTAADLERILARNAERGMPGCMGSIDCAHWQWRNCPTALAGTYQGKGKKRSIVMETVCDEDLWIWHFFVGCPGSYNDINVLHSSPLFTDISRGVWPPRNNEFIINGRKRTMLYYLADGIYPPYAFFLCPYANPLDNKQKTMNRLQEALRKDVERLYGVLTARFHITLRPARFAAVPDLITVATAVAILHNMVVELRRDGYLNRTRRSGGAGGRLNGDQSGGGGEGGTAGPDGEGAEGGGAPEGLAAGGGGDAGGGAGGVGAVAGPDAPAAPPPLPGVLPSVEPCAEPLPGSFLHNLMTWSSVTSTVAHDELREDMCAHVWDQRGKLLAPYL